MENKAPKLNLCYEIERNGKQIRGHETRCLALNEMWESTFDTDGDLLKIDIVDRPIINTTQGAVKHQLYHKGDEQKRFCVEITDTSIPAYPEANIVINYNIGAYPFPNYKKAWNEKARYMFGEDWYFTGSLPYYCRGALSNDGLNRNGTISGSVLVAPGGNKQYFYSIVDLGEIASFEKVSKLTVAHDLTREDFLDELSFAEIVVTTQSTAAMESLFMRKPTLVVATSDDQTGLFVENEYAETYTPEILAILLRNKDMRVGLARNDIEDNGSDVVERIYHEWMKWSEENES